MGGVKPSILLFSFRRRCPYGSHSISGSSDSTRERSLIVCETCFFIRENMPDGVFPPCGIPGIKLLVP